MSQPTLSAPHSYNQWSDCLDCLEKGLDDAATLAVMEQGTLEWTSGVAELFSGRISATLSVRLQRSADQLSRQLNSGADEVTLVRALLNSRRTLIGLKKLGTLTAFPALLQAHLLNELKTYAERTQNSLEDNAKSDRTGRLSNLIKNNSILGYESAPLAATTPGTGGAEPDASQPVIRRRNILA
jgi:hypothetical protein